MAYCLHSLIRGFREGPWGFHKIYRSSIARLIPQLTLTDLAFHTFSEHSMALLWHFDVCAYDSLNVLDPPRLFYFIFYLSILLATVCEPRWSYIYQRWSRSPVHISIVVLLCNRIQRIIQRMWLAPQHLNICGAYCLMVSVMPYLKQLNAIFLVDFEPLLFINAPFCFSNYFCKTLI